jgi:hypothetical protein
MKQFKNVYIGLILSFFILQSCGSSSSTLKGVSVSEVPVSRVTAINQAASEADVDVRLSMLFRLEHHQSNPDPILLNIRAVTHLQRGDHNQAIGLLREAVQSVLLRNQYLVSNTPVRGAISHNYSGSPIYKMSFSDMRPILSAMKAEMYQGNSSRIANIMLHANFDVSTPIIYPNSNANALVLQALNELSDNGAFGPWLITYINPSENLEEQYYLQVQILAENLITASLLQMDVPVISEAIKLVETIPVSLQTERLRYVIGVSKYLIGESNWSEYIAIRYRSMFR